jgi:hypothetical protein
MQAKNQMSWRGARPDGPKPVQGAADLNKRQQPVNSQMMGVSDAKERQPQGTAHDKEGKPTNR